MKNKYIRDMKKIASQLGNPTGVRGIELGREMHEKNFYMTKRSIALLDLQDGDSMLEIGPGSASHLGYLLEQAGDLYYTGLEISETMKKMAEQVNHQVPEATAKFEIYDGLVIPMDSGVVDKLFTVNTIYFWSDPVRFSGEIFRVLKPGGRFVIAFAGKDFMKKLPFTDFGFELYESSDVVRLMETAGFSVEKITDIEEHVTSASGEPVTRPFTVISFLKT